MKSYLINLDRSTERLEFFTRQAELLGIPIERISAVEGRRLSPEDLASAVSATFEFQPINAGEIGLFMSHKLAWQKLLASGEPHAAVFEDDAVMAPTMKSVMKAIDLEVADFDVIKLETTLRQVVCRKEHQSLSCGSVLQRLLSWHGGTAGYVISAPCARRLLSLKEKLADPIDQVMFNPMSVVSSQLRILQLNPAACIQKDILDKSDSAVFGTTIDRNLTSGKLFRHGPLIDIRRMIKKQIERQRRRWLTLNQQNCQSVIPFTSGESRKRAA
jgi:glycosyl transferase family 25